MTYAPEHGKSAIRPIYPMGSGSVCSPTSRLPTSEDDQGLTAPARSLKRHLLRPEEWLPLEATAKGLRTPWQTVYWWFGRWRTDGTFERLNDALRRRLRSRLGRDPVPSAAIADSQTTKTTGVGGEQRGYDGNKKVRGILSATCSWTPRDWCSRPCHTQREGP